MIDLKDWRLSKQYEVVSGGLDRYHPGLNSIEIINEVRGNIDLRNYVFSNVLPESKVVLIDLLSGDVVKQWDFQGLEDKINSFSEDHGALAFNDRKFETFAPMNGIAYYKPHDSFILTGKNWNVLFEVKLDYMKEI